MVLHIDMDAFYASVEERENPALKGKPVIVGGSPKKRGVVAAANYEARKFGVHSAMPAARAVRLCPHGVFLPGRIDLYAEVSKQIREIFDRYTPLVEPLSLDEAFLDATGSEKLYGPAEAIGRRIKQEIKEELKLVASVGVAPNKFLAKIASDLDKPDGFCVVPPDGVQKFLDPLPTERLWGVGKQSVGKFHQLGLRTIGQFRQMPRELVRANFGDHGEHFWRLAQGIDDRRVIPDREAKSISQETTFPADIDDRGALRSWLLELTDQVGRRLRRHELLGRTVTIKVRFRDFRTITRSETLADRTNQTDTLWRTAADLFEHRTPKPLPPVRLIGMGVSDLRPPAETQRSLFDDEVDSRSARLHSHHAAVANKHLVLGSADVAVRHTEEVVKANVEQPRCSPWAKFHPRVSLGKAGDQRVHAVRRRSATGSGPTVSGLR